jgi:SIR2-like domain
MCISRLEHIYNKLRFDNENYWTGITEINNLARKDESGLEIVDVSRLNEQNKLKLVKLHGSLDWFKLADWTIVKAHPGKKPNEYGKLLVEEEQMLYPIQQKDMYLYPWFDFLKQFKADLHKEKNWIVIGYRFNDEFIRNIVLDVLKMDKNKNHILILIDRNANDIVEEKLGGKRSNIQPIEAEFGKDKINSEVIKKMKYFKIHGP